MSAPLLQVLINLEATVSISLEQRMSRVDFRTVNSFGKKEGDMHGMRREPVSSPCHVLINLKRETIRREIAPILSRLELERVHKTWTRQGD